MKKTLLAVLLVSVAAYAAPASANYFSNPAAGASLNIGSAPNPKPFTYAPFTQVREQTETIPAPPPPPVAEAPAPPPAPEYVKTFMVFFDFDKSNLTPEARQVVSEAVRTAKEHGPVRIVVTGHTDTVGTHAYNQALSERRAMSVKNAMVAMGLDGAMIATVGKSFDEPLVATGPGIREPQNRRAVIDLTNPPVASLD
jgi:outer membrane protein OmpA-like peptidoglycan-associated protein